MNRWLHDQLRRARELALGVSVSIKVMGIALGLTLLFGSAVIVYVRASLGASLTRELEDKGASIASDLAARATDLILTNNVFALHQLVRETLDHNADVRYAFILDPEGNVLVHSFPANVPPALLTANVPAPNERAHLELFDTEEGIIRDLAAPIFDGRAGVARIGVSARRLNENLAATTTQLLLLTALISILGVAAALVLTRVLTRPIFDLVGATRAVAGGDLSRRVAPAAGDEIGQLTSAFNTMTADLERAYAEMVRRNRELAALNSLANAVSGPLPLNDVLARALDTTLEATNLTIGWVWLLDEAHPAEMVCWRGMSESVAQQEGARDPHACACLTAIQQQQPRVIAPLTRDCPITALRLAKGAPVACHAAVPLISRTQVLGVLNVAAADAQVFGQDDLNLLAAIGREIGVAIENARLWESLRQKERVRGQLLDQLIRAQEEERKRIARELHDETGQSLTSLLVGLKMVEAAPTLDRAQQQAQAVKVLAGDVLDRVRALARELRPSVLDDIGLVAALERYTGEYARRFDLAVDFQVVDLPARLPPPHEIALYRIVQEALTNIAKYARAQNVSVLLERRAASVVAIVEDDGCGFDVDRLWHARADGQHLGLLGMQERAELLGGKLMIESKLGEGTTVFVQLPLMQ